MKISGCGLCVDLREGWKQGRALPLPSRAGAGRHYLPQVRKDCGRFDVQRGAKDAMAACARAAKRFTQIAWTLRGPSVTFYPRVLKRCQSQKGNRLDDVLLLVPAGNTLVCVHVSAVTHLSALLFCGVCTLSLIAGGYPSIMAVTHVHDALKYCQNLKHDACTCTHARRSSKQP